MGISGLYPFTALNINTPNGLGFDLPQSTPPSDAAANRQGVTIPTTEHVWDVLAGRTVHGPLVGRAQELARTARAFHWGLELPDILAAGGFDVVLGNPPWDTMSPDVKEFFSKYDEQIRFLSAAEQKSRMTSLLQAPGVREAWDAHCRHLYVSANFMRESGRYKPKAT